MQMSKGSRVHLSCSWYLNNLKLRASCVHETEVYFKTNGETSDWAKKGMFTGNILCNVYSYNLVAD